MNFFRGGILILAGAMALFEAWKIRATGQHALLALVVGLVAIGVGVWRIWRQEPARR